MNLMVKVSKSSIYLRCLSQIKSCRVNGSLFPARILLKLDLQHIRPSAAVAEFFFLKTVYRIQQISHPVRVGFQSCRFDLKPMRQPGFHEVSIGNIHPML